MFVARSSSVKKFERCARRWRYSEDAPEPMTEALAVGTEVHRVLENWLTHGTPPPNTRAGAIARKGLHLLPPPSPALRVEVTDVLDVAPGIQFRRTIDLLDLDEPRLYDHKTYSQSKYIPTAEQLREDVQCSSYAWFAMELLQVDTLEATWVYYPKLLGSAVPVNIVFSRDKLRARWQQTLDSVNKMNALLDKSPQACDTNFAACNDYGKQCPFYKQCKGEKTMGLDLLSKMKKNLEITDVAPEPQLADLLQASILPPDAPADNLEAMPAEEPKRTRSKKVTSKPAEHVVLTYDPGPQAEAPAAPPGLELWIGAMRDGAHHIKLDTLAGPVADKVAEDNGVGHFGLIDYAKGSAILAAKFGEYLDTYPPFVPVFVDRVPSAIGKACLEVLVRRATTILRGV